MIEVGKVHPYMAITSFVFDWIACLVRQDYKTANQMFDEFESDSRIEEYFEFECEDGPIRAIDPTEGEWWQISFDHDQSDGEILVEASIPLAGEYRSMVACLIFTGNKSRLQAKFQYCKPS